MAKSKKVRLVLKPGHPHGCMYQTQNNGELISITAEGLVVDVDQLSEETLGLGRYIEFQDPNSPMKPAILDILKDEPEEEDSPEKSAGEETEITSHREGPVADEEQKPDDESNQQDTTSDAPKGEGSAPKGPTAAPKVSAKAPKATAKKASKKPAKKPAKKKGKK